MYLLGPFSILDLIKYTFVYLFFLFQSKVLTFDTAYYQHYIIYKKFTKIIDLMKSTTKSSIQVFKYRVYKLVITYLLTC